MDCRELKRLLPEYLVDALPEAKNDLFLNHLSRCPNCSQEVDSIRRVDQLIHDSRVSVSSDSSGIKTDMDLLTARIMEAVRLDNKQEIMEARETKEARKKAAKGLRGFVNMLPVVQDLVAAAAAALIIFWFSGSLLSLKNVPDYNPEVVKVTQAVGSVFQNYIDFSASAMSKYNETFRRLDKTLEKKD